MDHVGSVLLTRALMQKAMAFLKTLLRRIKRREQRKSSKAEDIDLRLVECAISFCPFEVTTLQRTDFEEGSLKGMWTNKGDTTFDPTYLVECVRFPAILLQHVESQTTSDPLPAIAEQKLKEHSDGTIPTNNPTKRIKSSARSGVSLVTNTPPPLTFELRKPHAHALNIPLELRQPRASPMTNKAIVLTDSSDDVKVVLRLPSGRDHTISSTRSSSTISGFGLPRSLTNEKGHPVNGRRPSEQLPHLSPTNPYPKKALQDLSSLFGPYHARRAVSHRIPLGSPAEASSTLPTARKGVLEQKSAARLKHFTPGHVISPGGAISNNETRDENVKAPIDLIDLTGDEL
ncbi:hypothetical protein B5807_10575 [Epicoccum nigrum]|uniref:Uncharacterized protein n=1 Tax=Epicoccum nigrum TaxID=105696 RepID=A0A1Y2LLN3_EPING|nr:hypothetical protein B5807_10575 [Epicoccum nigrum]